MKSFTKTVLSSICIEESEEINLYIRKKFVSTKKDYQFSHAREFEENINK